jgi:aspartyl-tRNA(Asn)/glutamyl-tRNA(Gln) amidotransferase subunit A
MNENEIAFLSVGELSRLIETREISPVEATEAYLERIDDLDFKFNAYLTVCRSQALEAAREAESAIARGNYIGPMHGVPVAVKDQIWTQGIRTTGGSRILADFVPEEDATVIANLKKAGAIVLGKTSLTEFAMGGGIERFSPPRNPWNLDMRTGGSSGGSGAATAAFLCATSLGEDTGGSIRFPATWCGLVGLRPTWGKVSRYGVMRGIWSMDTVGPISRTVEDSAITLAAIAGHDPKDPYTSTTPVIDYRQSLEGNIRGLRIGLVREQLDDELTDSETRDAVVKATTVLGELGATVEDVSLPLTGHAALLTTIPLIVEPA